MATFKDVIVSLRAEKEFSQEQLAKALHVSKSTVGMWETGDRMPSPEKFEEIADYFNVDMDYLYGRSPIRQKIHFDNAGNEYRYNNTGENLEPGIYIVNSSGTGKHYKALESVTTIIKQLLERPENLIQDNIVPFPQYPTVTDKDIDEFAARNAKRKFTREEIAEMLYEMKKED